MVRKKEDNKQNIVGFANPSDRKGARYLRIEIPGDNKILTLNEVEIISGGKNVARQGKASHYRRVRWSLEESTATRTLTGDRRSNPYRWIWIHKPLVEVDLGKEFIVDAVEVWNRKDFEKQLRVHRSIAGFKSKANL